MQGLENKLDSALKANSFTCIKKKTKNQPTHSFRPVVSKCGHRISITGGGSGTLQTYRVGNTGGRVLQSVWTSPPCQVILMENHCFRLSFKVMDLLLWAYLLAERRKRQEEKNGKSGIEKHKGGEEHLSNLDGSLFTQMQPWTSSMGLIGNLGVLFQILP